MRRPYVLPRPVPVLEDESLASLVTRNATPYAFENPMLILQRLRLDVDYLDLLSRKQPTDELASLLNVDPPVLRRLSSWNPEANMASVGGRPIRPMFLHLGLKRCCPACLEESAHHRAFWNVLPISTCSRHRLPLTTICPGCGKPPRWFGHRVERCGNPLCAWDLRRPSAADAVHAPAFVHVAGLSDLYAAGPAATLPGSGLTFERAVEVSFVLGIFAEGVANRGRSDTFLRRHPDRVPAVMEAGWGALSDWPNGFSAMLDDLRKKAGHRDGRYGLRREFGKLAGWLAVQVEEPWAAPLREAYASYLDRQGDLRTTGKALRRYGVSDLLHSRNMTLREACSVLKLSPEKMTEIAHREKLFVAPPVGTGVPTLLKADLVQSLRERRFSTLLKQEAAEILGLRHCAVGQLLSFGILSAVKEDERVTHQRAFLRSDLEDLLQRVRGSLKAGPACGKLVPMTRPVAGQRNVATVLQAILDGRLHARRTDPALPGLRTFLFDICELEEILGSAPRTLSLDEAALRLGVISWSFRTWVKEGYIPTIRVSSDLERGSRVTEEALAAFQAEFITSIDIATLARTSGKCVTQRLALRGFQSLSESTTALYRRSQITEAEIAAIRPRRSGGRSASATEAFELAQEVGKDIGEHLGLDLRREWNGFADKARDTYVQVVGARRRYLRSPYYFRFNTAMRRRLEAAGNGWLALALVGFDSYLLLPWSEARKLVAADDAPRQQIALPVDIRGVVEVPELRSAQRWFATPRVCDAPNDAEGLQQPVVLSAGQPCG